MINLISLDQKKTFYFIDDDSSLKISKENRTQSIFKLEMDKGGLFHKNCIFYRRWGKLPLLNLKEVKHNLSEYATFDIVKVDCSHSGATYTIFQGTNTFNSIFETSY